MTGYYIYSSFTFVEMAHFSNFPYIPPESLLRNLTNKQIICKSQAHSFLIQANAIYQV
jgi:hypothetical protein